VECLDNFRNWLGLGLEGALEARTLAGDFAVPVFVIQGAEDFTMPT
jgi:hypothetical protein